jgi:1-acyl-sn-glycerol-3-phosphate acyltransferase
VAIDVFHGVSLPLLPAEALGRRVLRRAVTVPVVVLGFVLSAALLPALLVVAAVLDLARASGRRSQASIRLLLFGVSYLGTEALGLLMLLGVWLTTLGRPGLRAARTFAVQRVYTAMHFASVKALFRLRFEVEGAELATPGPLLVFVRHASIVDTLVPAVFLANVHHARLRYVLKRELLVDPCLDVAGHWIPNHFVSRDGADTARETAAVRALKTGLAADEGVLLYPEGTRFTPEKQRRARERLVTDPVALARATALRHLLPPRPGGVLALLDASPACDVLFIGHHGLEGFARIADIWRGTLVGRTVTVRFWREAAETIPAGDAARLDWVAERWQRLDDWLEGQFAKER